MVETAAFVRQDFLAASSYKVRLTLSLFGLMIMAVPVYFVARGLQSTMADVIEGQGGEYFAFLIVGMAVFRLMHSTVNALPNAISSAVRTGTFEALLGTPIAVPRILVGMMGFAVVWAALQALCLLIVGVFFGADLAYARAAPALGITALLIFCYVPFGLLAAAGYMAFRTTAAIPVTVGAGSILLGGVYYPTEVIPSWIEHLSAIVPMTYGLRAIRKVLLEGASLFEVSGDVGALVVFATLLMALAAYVFSRALRYARRTGSLSQY